METKENNVAFALKRICTDQFAIISETAPSTQHINIATQLGFGIDKPNRRIKVSTLFKFHHKENASPELFMLIENSCFFEFNEPSWQSFNSENGKIIVPQNVVAHLTTIAVGTARGVLHARTENTAFNPFFLPTINVNELLADDVKFD